MEIGNKFGFDIRLFLFQLINFLIVVFILKKFLYFPLKKILDERKYKIKKLLYDTEHIKITLTKANEEKKIILMNAKQVADKMIASTSISLEKIKQKSIMQTKQLSDQILSDAKRKASIEFEIASKQISKMSLDIANIVIKKILSNFFDDDEKQKLLSRVIKKINDEKKTNIPN
ncbi:MAG: ATP synthase F0 subunit B [Endomicrobium sp.]|jgi:F-type H+-transporting ATPase subunit b|nr:ATP synthase F0 subunit B [Endomicrobium sp.]